MPKDQLAALVIAARKRAGFATRYAFAKAAGVRVSTIDGIEGGKTSPSVATLEKIMDAIDWKVLVTFRPRKRIRKAKAKP